MAFLPGFFSSSLFSICLCLFSIIIFTIVCICRTNLYVLVRSCVANSISISDLVFMRGDPLGVYDVNCFCLFAFLTSFKVHVFI